MSTEDSRNAYQELFDFIPGSAELPITQVVFQTPELTVEMRRISGAADFRNPSTINVRVTSSERRGAGVISGSFNVRRDGTMEGAVYEDGFIPGIDESIVNPSMTPKQSVETAIVLVDFLSGALK